MVRLTDRPDMTLDVYRGRKTSNNNNNLELYSEISRERGSSLTSCRAVDKREYLMMIFFLFLTETICCDPS